MEETYQASPATWLTYRWINGPCKRDAMCRVAVDVMDRYPKVPLMSHGSVARTREALEKGIRACLFGNAEGIPAEMNWAWDACREMLTIVLAEVDWAWILNRLDHQGD